MTRGALRFTEEQYREHAAKSDRFKIGGAHAGHSDRAVTPPAVVPKPTSQSGPITHQRLAAPESPALTPPSAPGGGEAPLLYPLVALCRSATLPEPTPEYSFHHTRKWRFDYAWPLRKIAVEIEGGIWTQGRHTRGAGFLADMEKYNEAAIHGWRVLRYTPEQLGKRTATIISDLLAVLG